MFDMSGIVGERLRNQMTIKKYFFLCGKATQTHQKCVCLLSLLCVEPGMDSVLARPFQEEFVVSGT